MGINGSSIKKSVSAVLMILLILLCSSCGEVSNDRITDSEPMPGQVKVYCTNSSIDALQWENYDLKNTSLEEKIEQVIDFLNRNPRNSLYKRLLPQDVEILSYNFDADGQLVLDFSADYLKMEKIQELLCRAGVVKTFCQLDGIDYIEFNVDGAPLKLKENTVGIMTDSDFVDNTGNKSDLKQEMKLTIYMTDENGKLLQEMLINTYIDGTKTIEEVVLEELISGARGDGKYVSPINSETKVNKVRTYDGICYVDFSEDFLSKQGKISDEVVVYSVVNTLCELQGINKVRLTIDGNQKKNFGKVPIDDFLSLRPELIAQEKAGESTGGK